MDNDFGTEAAFQLRFEDIDNDFDAVDVGIESDVGGSDDVDVGVGPCWISMMLMLVSNEV